MNLKKWVALLVTVATLASSPAKAECAPHKDILSDLFKNGYGWLSTAITHDNRVIQVFVNGKNGAWVIIGIDDDMTACVIAYGYDWLFTIERGV